jgi:acetyl esterase/lipase
MRPGLLIFLLLIFSEMLFGQNMILPLYPAGKIPNYRPSGEQEKRETTDILRVSLVQTPDIAVYLPAKRNATGQAMVICPGGGYGMLAYEWEGIEVAKWLNAKGIAAVVLKYRLPNAKSNITSHLSPLLDAKRALRTVRANAAAWNVRADRIGIMGFSAGGHLASTLLTQFDEGDKAATDTINRQSSRPDFGVLVYPVISMSKPVMHQGSRNNLIGTSPTPALATQFSSELQVKQNTPPTFLIHAMDDVTVPVENSLLFFSAMKEAGVTGELHVYPSGGHGFGLGLGKGAVEHWTRLCEEWLKNLGQ